VVDSSNEFFPGDFLSRRRTWLDENRLTLSIETNVALLPAVIPRSYRGHPVQSLIQGSEQSFILYGSAVRVFGSDYFQPSILVAVDPSVTSVSYVYDFSQYVYSPDPPQKDASGSTIEKDRIFEGLDWATQVGDTLYVANGYNGYAADSNGLTGYITAIDLHTNTLLWRSAPLTSNAQQFQVVGDVVVAGYGFTAEPDYLYVLDAKSGEVIRRIDLQSGPSYVLQRDGEIFVSCYDIEYTLHLE
jgi:hypothetical protein